MKHLSHKEAFYCALISILGLMLIGLIGGLLGYRVNFTSSMPSGLWRQTDVLGRDSIAAFCLPDSEETAFIKARHYLHHGNCPNGLAPLLKQVIATPGDVVVLNRESVSVNGKMIQNSATLLHDSMGRPMKFIARGHYIVKEGEYWFLSTERKNSLDSRYFGAIPTDFIIHGMEPVATFSNPIRQGV